jgi:hypothetical protein
VPDLTSEEQSLLSFVKNTELCPVSVGVECLRQRARECNAIAAWVRKQKNGTYLEGIAVACENRAFQLRQMAARWEATVSRNGGNG